MGGELGFYFHYRKRIPFNRAFFFHFARQSNRAGVELVQFVLVS